MASVMVPVGAPHREPAHALAHLRLADPLRPAALADLRNGWARPAVGVPSQTVSTQRGRPSFNQRLSSDTDSVKANPTHRGVFLGGRGRIELNVQLHYAGCEAFKKERKSRIRARERGATTGISLCLHFGNSQVLSSSLAVALNPWLDCVLAYRLWWAGDPVSFNWPMNITGRHLLWHRTGCSVGCDVRVPPAAKQRLAAQIGRAHV